MKFKARYVLIPIAVLAVSLPVSGYAAPHLRPGDNRDADGGGDNGDGDGHLSGVGHFDNPPASPLVIDLDGDGIELTPLEGSRTYFDLNVDGFAERTGWVQSDDGLLARDVNGNGRIDDNSDLFGNQTGHSDGFAQLSGLDSNGDGVIDSSDARFADLQVWRDYDQDGVSDGNELRSLDETGVSSIDLSAAEVDEANGEHRVSHRSTVTFTDGATGLVDDVHFQSDLSSAFALLPDGFEYHPDALVMPVLWGYGQIPSTWVSLSVNDDLRSQASSLLNRLSNGDVGAFMSEFESYVLEWAGVSDVDPDGRGPLVDARHLAFLEKAYGTDFEMGSGYGGNPAPVAALALEDQFDTLLQKLAGRFMAQSAPAYAYLNSHDVEAFYASFRTHPFTVLIELLKEYSPEKRGLSSTVSDWWVSAWFLSLSATVRGPSSADFDWVSGIVAPAVEGTADSALTLEDARWALSVLRPDLDDKAGYRAAIEQAYVEAGGDAAAASEFADGVFSKTQLRVTGTVGDDRVVGDGGDNVLNGREGNDVYVWGAGMGNDVINDWNEDWNESWRASTIERVVLSNLNRSDVRFVKMEGFGFSADLKVEVIATGEWLYLNDQLSGPAFKGIEDIEEIKFADGAIVTKSEFEAEARY